MELPNNPEVHPDGSERLALKRRDLGGRGECPGRVLNPCTGRVDGEGFEPVGRKSARGGP